ncbi:MAG: nucleotidyltransferase domain-containing protein [Lewinellaceae bacterium]|nr:nucleotidyltransferase domain-containing protein [Lewinellaceae bacterium]
MVTQSTALKIAHDYLNEVRALGVGIRKAILFGSFAQNRQHGWPDIDVALFADDFIGLTAFDKERFRSLHLIPKFMSVEVHTFPASRLEAGDPFVDEVKKMGIEIN